MSEPTAAERIRAKYAPKGVVLVTHDGDSFEVREPSIGLVGRARVGDEVELRAILISECVYVPGTQERVFPDKDAARGIGSADGGALFRVLADACLEFVKKGAVEARKNSEATANEV